MAGTPKLKLNWENGEGLAGISAAVLGVDFPLVGVKVVLLGADDTEIVMESPGYAEIAADAEWRRNLADWCAAYPDDDTDLEVV